MEYIDQPTVIYIDFKGNMVLRKVISCSNSNIRTKFSNPLNIVIKKKIQNLAANVCMAFDLQDMQPLRKNHISKIACCKMLMYDAI